MNYQKQTWTDGQTTVYAANMQHIEQGIADAAEAINELEQHPGGTVALTIGTVTSGDTASASITNGKLNLVLPRGAVGPQGPEGPKGAAGAQGEQGPKGDTGPAGPGFTDAAKGYILALFENAAYKNDTMQATYAALKAEWGMGSGTVVPPTPSQPDPPSQPDTPISGLPTPRYKLAAPKTFVPANKEFIDTGIKPFAAIDTGMDLTVYATFTVADSVASTVSVLYDCYSIVADGDNRGMMAATWTNGTVGMNMFTYGSHFVKIESGKKLKFLLQIKGTQFRFLSYGSLTEWKNIPNYAANKTVDRSLILGASWTDVNNVEVAGKTRFFGGTVYDFQVFDTALTDAQITTLMEAN